MLGDMQDSTSPPLQIGVKELCKKQHETYRAVVDIVEDTSASNDNSDASDGVDDGLML